MQIECTIKVTGFGWKEYWADPWNKFDFILVCVSLVDISVSFLSSAFVKILRVLKAQKLLRLLRLSRMVKMLKSMRSIKKMISTLTKSIVALGQVSALLALCFFMFACAPLCSTTARLIFCMYVDLIVGYTNPTNKMFI